MPKILIADSVAPTFVTELEADGNSVMCDPSITADTLPTAIADFEILVVRSTRVTRAAIAAARSLALIVRAGAGVDTIDIDAASEAGVLVTNTPGCNSDAVAELAIGHILACDRHIVDNSEHLRSGEWRKKDYLECPGLRGRTLGVIGAGQIARRVIRIAQSLGMRVVCCSPELDEALATELQVERVTDKLELARASDAVSLHIPLFPDTRHYCSTDFFNALHPYAIFVNTSRGEIVDTAALIEAIRTRHLRVGLDVYENEPSGSAGEFPDPALAGLLASCTCHIGGSTEQASDAVAAEALRVVRTFAGTGEALHCVNLDAKPRADLVVAVRHRGVLAEILALLAAHGAEVLSVNNQSLKGGASQTATLRVRGRPSVEAELRALQGVLSISVTAA